MKTTRGDIFTRQRQFGFTYCRPIWFKRQKKCASSHFVWSQAIMGTLKQGRIAIGVARNILQLLLDEMRVFNLRGTLKILVSG